MNTRYLKIDKELAKIITTEIHGRFFGKSRNPDPETVCKLIEQKNRSIVQAHQQKKIDERYSMIFATFLRISEGGSWFFEPRDMETSRYEDYLDRRGRLEALLSASLNAFRDETVKDIFRHKLADFEIEYRNGLRIESLIRECDGVIQSGESFKFSLRMDEETAVSRLQSFAPLRTAVKNIESAFEELNRTSRLTEMLRHLRTSINQASKVVTQKSRRESKYLFSQAKSHFHRFKISNPGFENLEEYMEIEKDLSRYAAIFDSLGEWDKRDQIQTFIRTIENTADEINRKLELQKLKEMSASDKKRREIDTAYDTFLYIKQQYNEGLLEATDKALHAAQKLNRCLHVLKSNTRLVKAGEIERFLNTTGLHDIRREDRIRAVEASEMFYKKAFFTLLPISLALALLCIYSFLLKN